MQTYPQKRLNFFLVYYKIFKSCRDGRVVECARLEIVLRGNTYGGSNPLLCAKKSADFDWFSLNFGQKSALFCYLKICTPSLPPQQIVPFSKSCWFFYSELLSLATALSLLHQLKKFKSSSVRLIMSSTSVFVAKLYPLTMPYTPKIAIIAILIAQAIKASVE